jgi:tetratricopeptide (TPR) repeat protein
MERKSNGVSEHRIRFRRGFPIATIALLGLVPMRAARAAPDDVAGEARQYHDTGLRLYNLANWRGALEQFRAAYMLKPDPAVLFNIGQCARQLADFETAAQSYRAFLRESANLPADEVEKVKGLVAQLEDSLRQQRARRDAPPTGVVSETRLNLGSSATSAKSHAMLYRRWWLWAGVSVAAAAIGVGLGVGLTPHSTNYPATGMDHVVYSF